MSFLIYYGRSGGTGSRRHPNGQVRIQRARNPAQNWKRRRRAPGLKARHSGLGHPSSGRQLRLTPLP